MAYIYKITNLINGKIYVGKRVRENPSDVKNYFGSGIAIRGAIEKYGKENFSKEILEYVDVTKNCKLLCDREKYWISKLNSNDETVGYNLTPGGDGACTHEAGLKGAITRRLRGYTHHSDETKRKISASHKGKSFSESHKKHLSENHHLRTLHKILFEDGHTEETFESLVNIAKRFGTTQNKLLRHSSKKEFLNGIILEGIDKEKYACCMQIDNSATIMCIDPILKDKISLRGLRQRKHRKPDLYSNIKPKECIIVGEEVI